jgi:hypothetical protein
MKNTLRHERCSTRMPPTMGPDAVAAAEALTQIPTARLRASPGKAALSRASVLGRIRAPKRPGAEEALDGAQGDHRRDARGQPDGQRAQPEADHADQEQLAAPVAVAQLAAEDEGDGDDQQVRVGDPLQVCQRGVEVLADVGVGHGDDRAVDADHDHTERHRGERQPGVGEQVRPPLLLGRPLSHLESVSSCHVMTR